MIFNDILKYSRRLVRTTNVTSSPYEVKSTDERIEFNSPNNLIIVTLPEITNSFKNRDSITFSVINGTKVEFRGTNGNYDDEYFQIGNDPLDESVKIYASNDGKWRPDGYGLSEQQAYYSSLSTGIIQIGTDSNDPTTNITDNGNGTLQVNFPTSYRIVDRVSQSNGAPVNNQYGKSRSRIFVCNPIAVDHTSITDGNILVVCNNTGAVSVIKLPNNQGILPAFSNAGPDINSHVQIGFVNKVSGNISAGTLLSIVNVNNNPINKTNNTNRAIGVINSQDNPITISPITSTIQIATNEGAAFTPSPAGYYLANGLNENQFIATAKSPTNILLINRAGDGSVVSITTSLNVTQYESSPGIFTAISGSKCSLNTIIAFPNFNAQLLGQQEFSGSNRLQDAIDTDEPSNVPNVALFGAKASRIAIDSGATDLSNTSQALFNNNPKQFR